MRTIDAGVIRDAVARLCVAANRRLPPDVAEALHRARAEEDWPAARETLDQIIANFQAAEREGLPVCQDTGMASVFLEIGTDVHIEGDLSEAVNEGVRRGYRDGYLRKSVVTDPLARVNSGDNTPAILYVDLTGGSGIKITVAPKGFGSENMSGIKMLTPAQGEQGIIDFVTETVRAAGANPCPPVVVGVGIGGNFDRAALLAKKALLRPLTVRNGQDYYARMEETLRAHINGLGTGPQGFGGKTTCLAVAIETFPTHIAGLPCAVNISCHASRHAEELL
ncbi:MAG: fumarate hydratase [Spirochaetaceae bacterium]|jgi:fumarate hydratase subunit alpha|nr:fumarate hydratase [Spirochaetaceae bacterium]